MPALWSAWRPVMLAGVLMLAGTPAAPAADDVPRFDVTPGCRAAARASVTSYRDENACKEDENAALDKLKQQWGQYNAAQRGHCTRLSALGGTPSYVELLTCLELAKAADELPDEVLNRSSQINR